MSLRKPEKNEIHFLFSEFLTALIYSLALAFSIEIIWTQFLEKPFYDTLVCIVAFLIPIFLTAIKAKYWLGKAYDEKGTNFNLRISRLKGLSSVKHIAFLTIILFVCYYGKLL